MERFFPLKHLTVGQLRDLYRDACKVGKLLVEHDQPGVEGHYEINLPEDEILKNISDENQNYLVFHENFENEPDATIIAFSLSPHPFTTAYIDIDNARLDWFVKKYGLNEPDATIIAFSLSPHPFTTAYIDIDNARLDWFVKKYGLAEWWQMEGDERKHYPFTKFYTLEPVKRHNLN